MKDSLTYRILETLSGMAMESVYLSAAIASSSRHASARQVTKKRYEIEDNVSRGIDYLKRKHSFYSLLHRLKKEGFITVKESKLNLTRLGREKFARLSHALPGYRHYERQPDETLKVIAFDIPEKHRDKRDWLRQCLAELGFKSIQKSVFIGKHKIPVQFMADLGHLDLLNYVEIFAVSKTGSLKRVIMQS